MNFNPGDLVDGIADEDSQYVVLKKLPLENQYRVAVLRSTRYHVGMPLHIFGTSLRKAVNLTEEEHRLAVLLYF